MKNDLPSYSVNESHTEIDTESPEIYNDFLCLFSESGCKYSVPAFGR